MSNGSELKSPGAQALRAAGYVPLPRWWVTQEQLDLIAYMIRDNRDDVNRIRAEAAAPPDALTDEERKRLEIEAAWSKKENRK